MCSTQCSVRNTPRCGAHAFNAVSITLNLGCCGVIYTAIDDGDDVATSFIINYQRPYVFVVALGDKVALFPVVLSYCGCSNASRLWVDRKRKDGAFL